MSIQSCLWHCTAAMPSHGCPDRQGPAPVSCLLSEGAPWLTPSLLPPPLPDKGENREHPGPPFWRCPLALRSGGAPWPTLHSYLLPRQIGEGIGSPVSFLRVHHGCLSPLTSSPPLLGGGGGAPWPRPAIQRSCLFRCARAERLCHCTTVLYSPPVAPPADKLPLLVPVHSVEITALMLRRDRRKKKLVSAIPCLSRHPRGRRDRPGLPSVCPLPD